MKIRKLRLYMLLYWNTFLNRFKKREKNDVFIYEDDK